MLIKVLKAEGHSMEPIIKNGSFFIVSSIPYIFVKPKKDDNVVFRFKNKIIVKRISGIANSKYIMEGLNKKDSKNFLDIDEKDILGKVIWIL